MGKYHCPTSVECLTVIDPQVNSDALSWIESLTAMTPEDEEKIITCDHCGTIYDANLSPDSCPAVKEVGLGEVCNVDIDQLKADAREAGEPEPIFVERTSEHTQDNGKIIKTNVVCRVIHESMFDKKTSVNTIEDNLLDDEAEFDRYMKTI